MSHSSNRVPEFFGSDTEAGDVLWQYLQSLSPEAVTQLSKPTTPEIFQAMERSIVGLLGALPPDNFGVTITTSRENLGRLLASAMMNGYFLRNVEQRMTFERSLQAAESVSESE